MARRWLPENVTTYRDRHGKARYRFRKKGFPNYTFKNAPGTPEFLAELEAAKTGQAHSVERHTPFTYDGGIRL